MGCRERLSFRTLFPGPWATIRNVEPPVSVVCFYLLPAALGISSEIGPPRFHG